MATKKFNLKAFVVASLRKATYRYPEKNACLTAARVERGKYKCAQCGKIRRRMDIQVDHITPIIGIEGFTTWDSYIERMFCDGSGFQVLCKSPCHEEKTRRENEIRKQARAAKPKKERK